MKIIYAIRPDYLENRGGDTVQILETKKAIESRYRVAIDLITSPSDLNNYIEGDLLHVFNLQNLDVTLEYLKVAKKLGLYTVLSPIYWDLSDAIYLGRYFRIFSSDILLPYLKRLISKLGKRYPDKRYLKRAKEILELSDLLLPNSDEEYKIIRKHFGVNNKYVPVPNAVVYNKGTYEENSVHKRNYVLQVGRIEPLKNQYKLIKALWKEKDIPIVIIGRSLPLFSKYYKKVVKLGKKRGNVTIIDELPHDKLNQYYQNAKVHVLASFRESPGLVTLEAMLNGANVVVSNSKYCPIHYYKFDEYAYICDPYSTASISKAINDAYNAKSTKYPRDKMKKYWETYSYEHAAEVTYNSYIELVNINYVTENQVNGK